MPVKHTGRFPLAALAVTTLLLGCREDEIGHVQLQVLPATAAATTNLYLDGVKLDFSRGATVLMRFAAGTISLKTANAYFTPAICKIVIRKDRLSVLSVMVAEMPPRCACQIRAPESTQ